MVLISNTFILKGFRRKTLSKSVSRIALLWNRPEICEFHTGNKMELFLFLINMVRCSVKQDNEKWKHDIICERFINGKSLTELLLKSFYVPIHAKTVFIVSPNSEYPDHCLRNCFDLPYRLIQRISFLQYIPQRLLQRSLKAPIRGHSCTGWTRH